MLKNATQVPKSEKMEDGQVGQLSGLSGYQDDDSTGPMTENQMKVTMGGMIARFLKIILSKTEDFAKHLKDLETSDPNSLIILFFKYYDTVGMDSELRRICAVWENFWVDSVWQRNFEAMKKGSEGLDEIQKKDLAEFFKMHKESGTVAYIEEKAKGLFATLPLPIPHEEFFKIIHDDAALYMTIVRYLAMFNGIYDERFEKEEQKKKEEKNSLLTKQ